jgi:hypothetical protein
VASGAAFHLREPSAEAQYITHIRASEENVHHPYVDLILRQTHKCIEQQLRHRQIQKIRISSVIRKLPIPNAVSGCQEVQSLQGFHWSDSGQVF